MSEETAKAGAAKAGGAGDEPSMEDILASIRRILSEEEEAAPAAPAAAAPAPAAAAPKPKPAAPAPAAEPEFEPEMMMEPEPEPAFEPEMEMMDEQAPAYEPEPEPEPMPMPHRAPPPMPEPMADVLQLTPEMITTEIMSEPTVRASTDVLAELARAILDRRDVSISRSSKDLTLEGMVREMLKPILREWLDRNLPYLIERLVKKEIDTMVNRAERLDD